MRGAFFGGVENFGALAKIVKLEVVLKLEGLV